MDMFVNDLNETMGPVLSGCIRQLTGMYMIVVWFGKLDNQITFILKNISLNFFDNYYQVKQVWHIALKLGETMERSGYFSPFSP